MQLGLHSSPHFVNIRFNDFSSSQSHACDFKYSKSCSFHTIAFTYCITCVRVAITYQQPETSNFFTFFLVAIQPHISSDIMFHSEMWNALFTVTYMCLCETTYHKLGSKNSSHSLKRVSLECACATFLNSYFTSSPSSSCIVGPHM